MALSAMGREASVTSRQSKNEPSPNKKASGLGSFLPCWWPWHSCCILDGLSGVADVIFLASSLEWRGGHVAGALSKGAEPQHAAGNRDRGEEAENFCATAG